MNQFNRIVVVILDLVLLAGAAIVLLTIALGRSLVPEALESTLLGGWLASFADRSPAQLPVTLAIAVAILLGGAILLYLELRRPRRATSANVIEDDLGRVTLHLAGVRHLVTHVASRYPEVEQVQADVSTTPQGLNVHCHVVMRADAQVVQTKERLSRQIRHELDRHLGVPVADVGILTQIRSAAQKKVDVRARQAH